MDNPEKLPRAGDINMDTDKAALSFRQLQQDLASDNVLIPDGNELLDLEASVIPRDIVGPETEALLPITDHDERVEQMKARKDLDL